MTTNTNYQLNSNHQFYKVRLYKGTSQAACSKYIWKTYLSLGPLHILTP